MALTGRTTRGLPYALAGDQFIPSTDTGQMMGEVDAQITTLAQRSGGYRGTLPAGTNPDTLDFPDESGFWHLSSSGNYPNLPSEASGHPSLLHVQSTGHAGEQNLLVHHLSERWTRQMTNTLTTPSEWTAWELAGAGQEIISKRLPGITDGAALGAAAAFVGTQFEATSRFSSIMNAQGNADLMGLDNPDRVTILDLGTSSEGRPIRGYRYGDPAKPCIYFLGMQHGDEPMGKEALLAWGRALGTETITDVCVVIVPFLNVDRMNLTRLTSRGTDLNRNWIERTSDEVQAAAKVYSTHDVRMFVDCHEGGSIDKFMLEYPRAAGTHPALVSQSQALIAHLTSQLASGPYPGAAYTATAQPGTARDQAAFAEKAVAVTFESPSMLATNMYFPNVNTRFVNYINVLGWTLAHFRANLAAYVTATDAARA